MTRAGKGKGKGKGRTARAKAAARKASAERTSPDRGAPRATPATGSPAASTAPGPGAGGNDVAAPLARYFLWADSPLAVHRVILGLGALCAFLFLFDLLWHRHAYVPGEGLWGFYAIVGFVSFTLIVLGAKALRTLIRRDEDYYGDAAIDAEDYPAAGLERQAATEGEDAGALFAVRDARVVGERA